MQVYYLWQESLKGCEMLLYFRNLKFKYLVVKGYFTN